MNHQQVQKLFLDWSTGRAGGAARLAIRSHLAECRECREYYDKLSLLLEKPDRTSLPHLEPDPFLPARIRAIAKAGAGTKRPAAGKRLSVVRASLATLVFAAAIAAGVFLGSGLSAISAVDEETDLAQAYYSPFSQSGFADDLRVVLEETQDEM